jgi:tetratricopeptide (TPR) repeat protein
MILDLMTPHLQRAAQLIRLNRHELAEKELRQALVADPNSAAAHALLASCLLERKAYDDAQAEAQTAVGLAPDDPQTHYMLARVWRERGYRDRAARFADEAIRLDPADADYRAFRAVVHFDASQWKEALASAEAGLSFDAEHTGCNNLRAMALVKLGRKGEAGATIDAALAREPENSWSHANKGWTLLESRKLDEALKHFRESLRLDPTNDYARAGIVEALKARNPIYGLFLRYMLWMAKLPPRWQFAVILGGFFGNRFLGNFAETNPQYGPWVLPIQIAYTLFAILTWMAQPIFNLLLRLNRFGRHALSAEQKLESNLIGGSWAAAIVILLVAWLGGHSAWYEISLQMALLAFPIHLVFQVPEGGPHTLVAGAASLLFFLILAGAACLLIGSTGGANLFGALFFLGFIASIWGGPFLVFARTRR